MIRCQSDVRFGASIAKEDGEEDEDEDEDEGDEPEERATASAKRASHSRHRTPWAEGGDEDA